MKNYLIGALILLSSCQKNSSDTTPIDVKGDIVFLSRRLTNSADWRIYSMNADGSNQKQMSNISTSCATPILSHDGKKVAFSYSDNTNYCFLAIVDIDGQNQRTLATGKQFCGNAAWSPDDAKLVFVKRLNGSAATSDIYSINADGTNETKLTTANNNYWPHYFSKSNQVLFAADNGTFTGIYKMNADGSNKQLLTPTGQSYGDPKPSPDDSKIAITSLDWNGCQIFVMNTDGSDLKQLTFTVDPNYFDVGFPRDGNYNPVWSPTSLRLAYVSFGNGSPDIFAINADGTANKRLTNTSLRDENPCWTSDGQYILFSSNRNLDVSTEIYVMKANGQWQTPLTNYVGDDVYPVFVQK